HTLEVSIYRWSELCVGTHSALPVLCTLMVAQPSRNAMLPHIICLRSGGHSLVGGKLLPPNTPRLAAPLQTSHTVR
ncbi:MAG: hypothetical protein ACPIOQ_25820, partial [Promethearchaeia archaeon]